MNVRRLDAETDVGLAAALNAFESGFSYPLGARQRFSIDHGADYTRFFRAMGNAQCFVAEREGAIAGVLAAAVRSVVQPDGTAREACYLGDLKIARDARGRRVLLHLARSAMAWMPRSVEAAYAVVMGGTEATPDGYTGRAGLPVLRSLSHITIARFETVAAAEGASPASIVQTSAESARACLRRFSLGRYCTPPGDASQRSAMTPVWLMHCNGRATGLLEDTRLAKRLVLDDGTELTSAHLSGFAYSDPASGAVLVEGALARAHALGFPALFVAVPAAHLDALLSALGRPASLAPATVFGHGFAPGIDWNINTAEI